MPNPSYELACEIRKILIEKGVFRMSLKKMQLVLYRRSMPFRVSDIKRAMGMWHVDFILHLIEGRFVKYIFAQRL